MIDTTGKGHLLLEHQKVDPQIKVLIDTWLAKQLKTKGSAQLASTKIPTTLSKTK